MSPTGGHNIRADQLHPGMDLWLRSIEGWVDVNHVSKVDPWGCVTIYVLLDRLRFRMNGTAEVYVRP
jgi:hypothetical protein